MNKNRIIFALLELKNEDKIEILKSRNNIDDIDFKDFSKDILPKDEQIEEFMNKIQEKKINFTIYGDEDYPDELKKLYMPPAVLYYKGDLNLVNTNIAAVVGSRKCSYYGSAITKSIAGYLSSMNITIISGAARGIDSISHRVAIEKNTKTIAVLGCGIDVYYPMENKKLIDKIAEDGLLLSEFPLGYPPLPKNFPQRNRIISALSKIVIVTEASEKSGSLYTVTAALELGKDVMAVPGSINENNYKGCNNLIKEGALMYTSKEDLSTYFGIEIKEEESTLSEEEKRILQIINFTPKHLEDIKKYSKIDYEKLNVLLLNLQFKNKITCIIGNYYVKCVNE
ncbi:MAG: DNA-processing protein DprA [Oscillospiraceae bacterium]|nr:DNA-processing protein DprA [Oscillospiraceae bacterium]